MELSQFYTGGQFRRCCWAGRRHEVAAGLVLCFPTSAEPIVLHRAARAWELLPKLCPEPLQPKVGTPASPLNSAEVVQKGINV